MNDRNSASATLFSVIAVFGALALFCLIFTAFLLVPFFVFIGAGIALMVSEWGRKVRDESPASADSATTVGER